MSEETKSSGFPKVVIVILVVIVVLCIGVFAAFMAIGKLVKSKMAESGVSYNLNQNGNNGSFTFKTEEGDVSMQAGDNVVVPAAFPSYFLYPGAKVAAVVNTKEAMAVTLTLESANSDQLVTWYKDILVKNGWKITNPSMGAAFLTIENDTHTGIMTIVVDKGQGHIQINLSPKK